MKILLLTPFFFGVFVIATSTNAAPIHRWSFGETGGSGTVLIDSVGGANGSIVEVGGNNATVSGGQVRLTGGAKGSSDYARLGPTNSQLLNGVTSGTMEVWATQHSVQNWGRVFSFGGNTDGTDNNSNAFLLAFNRGTSGNTQRLQHNGTPSFDSNTPLSLDQEHHMAIVWDETAGNPGRYEWYLDGALVGGGNTGGNDLSNVNDNNLWLGRSQWGDNTANADWNEFRIYDTALSAEEVIASFRGGADFDFNPAPVPEPASIAIWTVIGLLGFGWYRRRKR